MRFRQLVNPLCFLALCMAAWAYADDPTYVYPPRSSDAYDPKTLEDLTSPGGAKHTPRPVREAKDPRLTFRAVSEKELLRQRDKDRELTLGRTWEILARINYKATHYITEDVKNGLPMHVPNDFSAYKDWTPLPRNIVGLSSVPKFILVVKDIPFVGWYEEGELIGDSVVCIGKLGTWTRAGLYGVQEKDIDHVSRSYRNAYGMPAMMPYGLRIYGRVWIHGGDISSGYCSHGCINLPLRIAEELFNWAERGTRVMVVESLNDLYRILEKNSSKGRLLARRGPRPKTDRPQPATAETDASDE
jgi:hypothetical protein